MNKGTIFDIARFCLHDGPGIRTTVFLKGCPLQCLWCHNPESQSIRPEILFTKDRCNGCGACEKVCPAGCHRIGANHSFDRGLCTGCGLCAEVCPTKALRLAGRRMTAEEILQVVCKDRVYYEESGGGLTVSGGEPLMQAEFLEELLRLAKQKGLHTCIETCGYAPGEAFKKILPYTDCFLFDWKESDGKRHKMFTGKSNAGILENLAFLNSQNAKIILRLPLIPGYNDTEEHIDGIADLTGKFKNIRKLEIMPYHPLGLSKAAELDRPQKYVPPTLPDKDFLAAYAKNLRSKVAVEVAISH